MNSINGFRFILVFEYKLSTAAKQRYSGIAYGKFYSLVILINHAVMAEVNLQDTSEICRLLKLIHPKHETEYLIMSILIR